MNGMLIRAGAFLALLLSGTLALGQAEGPVRSITPLAGNVYRFQSDNHYGVFMTTSEGVIVADPLSPDTAAWLRGELQQRFGQSVEYVLYSHHHADHVSGAGEFEDATVVAHANAVPHIEASQDSVMLPDLTFSSEMVVTLGEGVVHLYYLGASHTDNLVYMVFPEERILFAVDTVSVNRLPFESFQDTDVDSLIGALTALEEMDVDIVVPGHGEVGTLADLRAHREYIENLKDRVTELLRIGNSDAAIKQAVTMSDYSHWAAYDEWHDANVEGMIAYVKSNYRF